MRKLFVGVMLAVCCMIHAVPVSEYNIKWNTQSKGSHESMPCGGGDIGLNVWVEQDDILFYMNRSGAFDENNCFLKQGRVRIKLTPNPFAEGAFSQELHLNEGYIEVKAGDTRIQLWADVHSPIIYVDIQGKKELTTEVSYENWRYKDRELRKGESQSNSYKWAPPKGLVTIKDSIFSTANGVRFFHRNIEKTIFDVAVSQQGMESVKGELMNPLRYLTFGGELWGDNLQFEGIQEGEYKGTDYNAWVLKSKRPAKNHSYKVALHVEQTETLAQWFAQLNQIKQRSDKNLSQKTSRRWWNQFWERSFIRINPSNTNTQAWELGRNYQLFRYMLGCNAYGVVPTKFNGGLFTFDPEFVDPNQAFTPDYRKWGGGTMTAQNQRLVYFPMLKSGDFDMLPAQWDYYIRMQRNAELRSKVYWGIGGACFVEQLENFGLPNPSEYGWKRPDYFDKGIDYNAWLEYQWDTVFEFCLMMFQSHEYTGKPIDQYLPFIESCLTFFDEYYRLQAKMRGRKELNEQNHLILYPGSSCETYKMTYNSTTTIEALNGILKLLIAYPGLDSEKRERWEAMYKAIPPVSLRQVDGHMMIAPAQLWERVNNVETPQLYPVYPWRSYGVGKPDLEYALNTYHFDPDALKFRSHIGWKQDNIFAACLGLTDEAERLSIEKLKDGPHRFPAFWGPGYDWTPDHNWGGSAMIGLQEMLLQTDGDRILLFPAWPKKWDVHFKMHAPGNTTVEVVLQNGRITRLEVTPKHREKDIELLL